MDMVQLARVGRLVRDLHEALPTFEPSGSERWQVAIPPDREELVCHHDLAPWNLVLGADRWVFIDWDGAGPGSRLWDLAYAAPSPSHRSGPPVSRTGTPRGCAPWWTGTAPTARSGSCCRR